MKKYKRYIICAILVLIFSVFAGSNYVSNIYAGSLTGISLSETNTYASSSGDTETSTQTIDFQTATASTLTEVSFTYTTTSTGSTIPAHLSLATVTLGAVTGLNASWTLDTSSASSGILKLVNTSGQSLSASTSISVTINTVDNPYIGDCNASATFYDTCYIQIASIDTTGTQIDTGTANYGLQTIPSMSFSISGVASGVITNGIQTTQSTTSSSMGFGDVSPGDVSYVAQQLTVTTNADKGYNTYVKFAAMSGIYSGKFISPFAAPGASWTTPVAWTTPTGTTPGSNTGWLGINTSDIRVSGWSNAGAEFAPADGNMDLIMQSTGPDTNKSIYITYAFGVNSYQPSDQYTGSLEYYIVPTY